MKTQLIKFVLLALFFTQSAIAGFTDYLEPSKIAERIKEEYAELDTGFKVELLDLNLFEGVGISSKYRYQIEPGYDKDYHTRIDRWELKADISAGDILKDSLDLPVYLNISRGSEVFFVRQFKRKKDSIKALPYTLKHLPLRAKWALKNLNPGDFVALPANLNVVIGAQYSSSYTGPIGVAGNANIYYMLSGGFLIHVYRMEGSKVRLKLITTRSRGGGTTTSIGGSSNLFGIKIADKLVEKVFELDFVEAGYGVSNGRQFVLDYVFDLSDKDAAKAYNTILSSTYKFKDAVALAQSFGNNKLSKAMISTYAEADKIYNEDKEKETPRIERIFKGLNRYTQKQLNLKMGLIVARFKGGVSYTKNNISFEDEEGKTHRFYYPIQTKTYDQKLGLGILFKYKEKISKSMFGLVPTGEIDNGAKFSDFGMLYTREDKIFRDDEQAHVKEQLAFSLPNDVLAQIDWKDWNKFENLTRARISYHMVIKASAFEAMEKISLEDMKQRLIEYYKTRSQYAGNPLDLAWDKLVDFITIKKVSKKIILKRLAKKLYKVINTEGITGKERVDMLMKLRNDTTFKKIGLGFLVSLIPRAELENHIQVKLLVQAKDRQDVSFNFGNQGFSELYLQLQHVQNAINNRSYDLRLNHEENNNQ